MIAVTTQKEPILVLGSGLFQAPLVDRLSQRGYPVIVVGPSPPSVPVNPLIKYVTIDLLDQAAITRIAIEHHARVALSTASEIGAQAAARVNATLGLHGPIATYIDWGLDKLLMRQALDDLYLPNIPFCLLTSEDGLRAFESQQNTKSERLVVKPRGGWGSRDVCVTENSLERQKAYAAAVQRSFKKAGAIIESYLEDPEFGGNAYFVDGDLRFLAITEKSLCNDLRVRSHWYEPQRRYHFEESLKHILSTLASHAGFKAGILNFDIRCSDFHEPILLDIGFRDGGNGLGLLITTASGKDSIDISISYALEGTSSLPFNEGQASDAGFSLVCFSRGEHDQVIELLTRKNLLTRTTILSSTNFAPEQRTPVVCFVTHGEGESLREVYAQAINLLSV